VLAHEIRNPPGSMELFTGLLADATAHLPETRQRVMHLQAGLRALSAKMTNVVDVYINYLQRKVDIGHHRPLIRTIRGIGYQIGGSVPVSRMRATACCPVLILKVLYDARAPSARTTGCASAPSTEKAPAPRIMIVIARAKASKCQDPIVARRQKLLHRSPPEGCAVDTVSQSVLICLRVLMQGNPPEASGRQRDLRHPVGPLQNCERKGKERPGTGRNAPDRTG
jgi:hypothetical protein